MSPERWQKIHELFEAALERPADERAAFLAHASACDEEVRLRVEAMLAADAQDDLLMDRPAYEITDALVPSNSGPDDSQGLSDEMIGVYRLTKELGRGGMGTVYLAYDTRLRRRVALKLLPSRLVNNPERVHRFQREARAASALNHPNIITIYDFGQENGRDYIASEFVEGRTLRDYVKSSDHSLDRILDVVIQVASALEAAHSAGIVHRDIKPENVMLRPDGYVKVLDFGLAKLSEPESGDNEIRTDAPTANLDFETRSGIVMGTVNYMSPEQVRGEKVDGRSDLFSLGIILYELITGNRPFVGKTWHHTMVAITDADPPPIADNVRGATAALQKIIGRALAKGREQRYQTARELLADLEAVQVDLAAGTRIQGIKSDPAHAVTATRKYTHTKAARVKETAGKGAHDDRMKGELLPPAGPKRNRFIAAITITVLAVAAAYFHFGRGPGSGRPTLTDKDTILLTDFVNTTGDAVFDDTLKQGLMVQFEQSPYFNILSDERARETLKLMERSSWPCLKRIVSLTKS